MSCCCSSSDFVSWICGVISSAHPARFSVSRISGRYLRASCGLLSGLSFTRRALRSICSGPSSRPASGRQAGDRHRHPEFWLREQYLDLPDLQVYPQRQGHRCGPLRRADAARCHWRQHRLGCLGRGGAHSDLVVTTRGHDHWPGDDFKSGTKQGLIFIQTVGCARISGGCKSCLHQTGSGALQTRI